MEVDSLTHYLGTNPHISSVTGLTYGSVDARLDAIEQSMGVFGQLGLKNLVILGNTDRIIDVSCDAIACEGYLLSGLTGLQCNMNNNGLNGLDTGTIASNTWYTLWIVYNPQSDGRGVLATALTTPNMGHASLSGYTKKRRVGAMKTQPSAANLLRYQQQDQWTLYEDANDTTPQRVLAGGTSTNWAAVTFSPAATPSTSRLALVNCVAGGSTAGYTMEICQSNSPVGGGNGLVVVTHMATAGHTRNALPVRLNASYQLYYRVSNAALSAWIDVIGYYDPI